MKKWTFLLGLLAASISLSASTPLARQYIETYKDIAVKEMHRSGIPASIKLAQGLLESDWGRSNLATVANNHFGIKCGSQWSGGTFYKEDDDRDEMGRLVESCFRAFADGTRSYEAHSDFLRDPAKAYRYGRLFELSPTDYISWAHGLHDAGYATDPRYPQKLITVIEKYNLHQYDTYSPSNDLAVEHVPEAQPLSVYAPHEKHAVSSRVSPINYKISAINRVPMVIAPTSTTLADIAGHVGLSVDLLLQYNDGYNEATDPVLAGSYIYLQRKKRSYVGSTDEHIVADGESMDHIAQRYGIRVDNLYAKNKMPKQATPVVGARLHLRKPVLEKERPKFTRQDGREPDFLDAMPPSR